MRQGKEAIIAILKKQSEPISSTTLASMLSLSSRTIKNHIKSLNEAQPGLIRSTPNGYLLNRQMQIQEASDGVAQSYEERFTYITHSFFVDHASSLNIYDLCDELYLSYSSMKQLISKLNQQYEEYDLSLKCKNDEIYLHGAERNKRRFLTNTIYKEAAGHMIDTTMLKKHFPDVDISYIQHTLHQIFQMHNCYINDFGYTNLSLHITVIIDRIINGNAICDQCISSQQIHPLSEEVVETFADHFHITFNPMERQNMNELILANMNFSQGHSPDALKQVVGEEIFQMTNEIIDQINECYHLSLNKETLLYPLSLHFKSLFYRNQQETSLKNPLLETIQSSCPLLYDCAIFITDYLDENFSITINADETAYLAMHIGADLERQQKDIKKLRCALLCPDYQQSQQQIYNYLLIHFDSDITIPTIASFEEDLRDAHYDIIFTTIPLDDAKSSIILIPPIKSAIPLKEIYNQIQAVLEQKKLLVLYESYHTFFSSSLFYYDADGTSERDDVLKLLCKKLHQEHYVSNHFFYDVSKREEAASTAFGQIAIPHSMKMDAQKTGIALAISNQGISWGKQKVHIVLLIAINEADSYLFKELYEAIILLFAQPQTLPLLRRCKSFEEFSEVIFSMQQVQENTA